MDDKIVVTMEAELTQGGFPFHKGSSYRVNVARAVNLILGGYAIEAQGDVTDAIDAPDEVDAIPRYYTVDELKELGIIKTLPGTAPQNAQDAAQSEKAPEPDAAPAPETTAPTEAPATPPGIVEGEAVIGAEALTGGPRAAGAPKGKGGRK